MWKLIEQPFIRPCMTDAFSSQENERRGSCRTILQHAKEVAKELKFRGLKRDGNKRRDFNYYVRHKNSTPFAPRNNEPECSSTTTNKHGCGNI